MPKLLIKDLKVSETIDSFFVLKQKDLKKTTKGDPYLTLKLADKTGDIEARWWDGFLEILDSLKEGSYLRVYAEVTEYQGKKQLTIKKAKVAEASEVEPSDYIRQTAKDIPEMWQNLVGTVSTIQDADLKRLLEAFLNDKKISDQFKRAPAAKAMHSACLGGLLEHVDGLIGLALFTCSQYPQVNRDLLLAGVILHDIGKLEELAIDTTIRYTDEGQLVGHIVMGVKILNTKINELKDFPAEKRMLLEHLILAHHGVAEFGSPKQPMTLEAVVLHYIDNIDAKIVGYSEFVAQNPQVGGWTPKAFMFDNRPLYVGEGK